jgi:hypothetical protein
LDEIPSKAEWQMHVSEDRLEREPLDKLEHPGSDRDVVGMHRHAAVERMVCQSVVDYDPQRFKLVGWRVLADPPVEYEKLDCELVAVVEDLQV